MYLCGAFIASYLLRWASFPKASCEDGGVGERGGDVMREVVTSDQLGGMVLGSPVGLPHTLSTCKRAHAKQTHTHTHTHTNTHKNNC